jgi:glycosyltransferase involved in cell wall biosynthesis
MLMHEPLPLSLTVITLNEEENLPRCLESVHDLAAEIVVIDSGSTDRTGEIARRFDAKFEVHQWPGFAAQKNHANARCTQPWILCLDADEALSPELADSLRQLFATGEPGQDGFWVNRRNFYLGRWIWHAWYPEWRLRLVRRGCGSWQGLEPHPKIELAGPTARLRGDLLHYPFRDLQDHLQRWLKYARQMAEQDAAQGRRCRWYNLVFAPWLAFLKRLVLKQAWRDGWRGWVIAFANLIYVFAKHAFLWEKQRASVSASAETTRRK